MMKTILITLSLVTFLTGCATSEKPTDTDVKPSLEFKLGSFENFDGATSYETNQQDVLVYLQSNSVLDASHIKSAKLGFDSNMQPMIELTLNDQGAKLLGDISQKNLNKVMAILVDNKVVLAAFIRDPILHGGVMITGLSSVNEAKSLHEKIDRAKN